MFVSVYAEYEGEPDWDAITAFLAAQGLTNIEVVPDDLEDDGIH